MTGDASSSVAHLREPWESADQWTLRLEFLRRHWGKLNEDRLVCLSQMFINIEFMGCQYRDELMKLVAEMSAGIADEYRQERRAAVHKVFGQSFVPAKDNNPEPTNKRQRTEPSLGTRTVDFAAKAEAKRQERVDEVFEAAQRRQTPKPTDSKGDPTMKKLQEMAAEIMTASSTLGPLELLSRACKRASTDWTLQIVQTVPSLIAHVSALDGLLLCQVMAANKVTAKMAGAQLAVERLKQPHFEIRDFTQSGAKCKALYTNTDVRVANGWKGPEAQLFTWYETQLTTLCSKLKQAVGAGSSRTALLESCCAELNLSVNQSERSLPGWAREWILSIDSVAVARHTFKGAKELTAERKPQNMETLSALAVDNLTRPHRRIYESSDNSAPYALFASDTPITHHIIQDAISTGTARQRELTNTTEQWHEQLQRTVVLVDRSNPNQTAAGLLHSALQFSQVPFRYEECNDVEVGKAITSVFVHDQHLCSATGDTKKSAKDNACVLALELLSKHCYTLITKCTFDSTKSAVGLSEIMQDVKIEQQQTNVVGSDNIGSKLMAKMGYRGSGGLGKQEQGISEPIQAQAVWQRQGFGSITGSTNPRQFRQAVEFVLNDYKQTAKSHDELVFAADLTIDQRKIIHQCCARLGLKSTSYGVESRQLVVRHKQNAQQLIDVLLSAGGETSKYKVCAPGTWNFHASLTTTTDN